MELQTPFTVVTPTLDGDVLSAMAPVDTWLTVAEIHRVIGRHSEAGVRKAIARLERQGIVVSQTYGRTASYRLNRDHLAADAVLEIASSGERLMERIRDLVGHWDTPPVCVVLFGSAARRAMTPESDVDLFVLGPDDLPEGAWDDALMDLEMSVRRWTGNPTQVVEMVGSELDARLAAGELLLREVVEEGRIVAGGWPDPRLAGQP